MQNLAVQIFVFLPLIAVTASGKLTWLKRVRLLL